MRGLDLFSGARGWEARAHASLGVDLLGIEWWEPAVKTSEAAGLRTLHADVAALDPLDFADEIGDDGVLVGSPPCQSRSNAGKRLGAKDVEIVARCMTELARGIDLRAEYRAACADERSILTVEPLRWAVALRPRAVVLEQVPGVLPDWKLVGSLLGEIGYSWWAGILEAERYGVPQTRERAVLIARRDGEAAHPPAPTHHRYVPGEPRPVESDALFGGGLLPWVTMAEALGWENGPSPSPSPSVTGGGGSTGGVEVFASAGARARAAAAVLRMTKMANSAEREAAEPAPTMAFGHDSASARWFEGRPATNVNGDPRVSRPGHDDPAESGSQQRDAIRVTVQEAAILQSFPPDWPWQGSRTAQFTQVGNAVPPLLGEAILSTLTDVECRPRPT